MMMRKANYFLVLLVLISVGGYRATGCPTLPANPTSFARVVGNVATISLVVDTFTISAPTECVVGMTLQTAIPFHFTDAQMAIIDVNTGMQVRAVPDGISGMFEGEDDAFDAVTNAALAQGAAGSVLDGLKATFSAFSAITLAPNEALAIEFSGVIGEADPAPASGIIFASFAAGSTDNIKFTDAQMVDIPLVSNVEESSDLIPGKEKKCHLEIHRSGFILKCDGKCPHDKTCTKVKLFDISKKACNKLDGLCIPKKWRRGHDKNCKICIFCKCKRVGGKGDPHFIGFNGHHFDFMGRSGEVFNLITDTGFTVNSLFVNADLRPQKIKTYMGTIGVVIGRDQLEVACDRVRNKRVIVIHGSELPTESRLVLPNNAYVERGADDKVVVNTRRWQLMIRFSSSNHSSCHLNFAAKFNKGSFAGMPTGILGNTIDQSFTPTQEEILQLTDTFLVHNGLFGSKSEQNVLFNSQEVSTMDVSDEDDGSWLVALSGDSR